MNKLVVSVNDMVGIRLKSRESQKYIDLGLAENNEFAACMHTDGCTLQI